MVDKQFPDPENLKLPTCEFKGVEPQWPSHPVGGATLTGEASAALSGDWRWELQHNGKDKDSRVQTPLCAPPAPPHLSTPSHSLLSLPPINWGLLMWKELGHTLPNFCSWCEGKRSRSSPVWEIGMGAVQSCQYQQAAPNADALNALDGGQFKKRKIYIIYIYICVKNSNWFRGSHNQRPWPGSVQIIFLKLCMHRETAQSFMVIGLFPGETRPTFSVGWEKDPIHLWNRATTRPSHLMAGKYFFRVMSQNQSPHCGRNNDLIRISCFRIVCFDRVKLVNMLLWNLGRVVSRYNHTKQICKLLPIHPA